MSGAGGQGRVFQIVANAIGGDAAGCQAQQIFAALRGAGLMVVPINPTKEMHDAAWADAHDEDAAGVRACMVGALGGT